MRVLIVDDSLVFRSAIKQAIQSSSLISEIDTASNGRVAISCISEKPYDLVIMDIEMPVMDGVEAIKEIRKIDQNVIVIIFSSQTLSSASKTLTALELGANDFVKKVENSSSANESVEIIRSELVPRIEALLKTNSRKQEITRSSDTLSSFLEKTNRPELICIASSTGGPETLKNLFKKINKNVSTPMLVVQHMPPVFTTQLAKMLDGVSEIQVSEAQEGDVVEKAKCLIAPGDFHMELKVDEGKYYVSLNQQEKECFVRPAANKLMRSLTRVAKGPVLSFVLTGMGDDGKLGCIDMKKKGWNVVIQDEKSSVVWGMPGAVHDSKAFDFIGTIDEIASIINELG